LRGALPPATDELADKIVMQALRRAVGPALRGVHAACAPIATVGSSRVFTSAAAVDEAPKGPKMMDVSIYRWNPEDGAKPRMDTYQVSGDTHHACHGRGSSLRSVVRVGSRVFTTRPLELLAG